MKSRKGKRQPVPLGCRDPDFTSWTSISHNMLVIIWWELITLTKGSSDCRESSKKMERAEQCVHHLPYASDVFTAISDDYWPQLVSRRLHQQVLCRATSFDRSSVWSETRSNSRPHFRGLQHCEQDVSGVIWYVWFSTVTVNLAWSSKPEKWLFITNPISLQQIYSDYLELLTIRNGS